MNVQRGIIFKGRHALYLGVYRNRTSCLVKGDRALIIVASRPGAAVVTSKEVTPESIQPYEVCLL